MISIRTEFINEQAHTSQQRINLIMDHENNTSFGNLNNWARKLKTDATTDTKDISIPLLFELISKTEALPSPTETNGIDLKKIYSVLANLMAGYPIEKLDAASEAFLKECYKVSNQWKQLFVYVINWRLFIVYVQDLLEEVNETDVKGLKRAVHILNANDETDPLAAVSDILDRADRNLVKVLSNDEMNPLNLPLPFTER